MKASPTTGEKAGEQEGSICYFQSHCFKKQSRCLSLEDFLPCLLDLEVKDTFSWLSIILLKCSPRIFSRQHVRIVFCQLGKILENKECFSVKKKKKCSFITALKGCFINILGIFSSVSKDVTALTSNAVIPLQNSWNKLHKFSALTWTSPWVRPRSVLSGGGKFE